MENYEVDMIVEIPYNSQVKYEYDEKIGKMRCDRILNTAMLYPGNYGYIPHTLSGDGDPLDILLITEYSIYPGTIVKVRMIGVLYTEDEKGKDEKLLAVPSPDVDNNYEDIHNLEDLSNNLKKKIKHFFTHYKDNDKNKWVKVKEFGNKQEAYQTYINNTIPSQTKNNYFENIL